MRFLYFIQQDNGIGTTANRLGEVPALFIADISWRRTHQPRHGVFLHKLGHVDTHHGIVAVEHKVSQRFAQFGFPYPGWPKEQERANRTVGIGQPSPATTDGVRYGLNGLVLANHTAMQLLLHTQQFFALAFHHAGYRDPGPARQHFGDLGIGHFVTQQAHGFAFRLRSLLKLFLQLGDFPVLQLGHAGQVANAAGLFNRNLRLLQLSFNGLRSGERGFLCLPLLFQH